MKVTREKFFEISPKFDIVPFTQSKGWHDFNAGYNIEYWVDSDIDLNIGFWALVTQHKILGKKLIVEGICLKKNTAPKIIKNFLSDTIKESEADAFYLSDISEQDANLEIALRRSGLKRPLALGLCPMTILVDCQAPFNFHRNWRRQVKKSIDCGNVFEVITNPTESELIDFIALFEQLKDRKALGYNLSVAQLKQLIETNEYFISFILNKAGKPLCGRMTYVQNNHAYDIFAANSNEGLSSGAIYHNQQGLLEYLKENGVLDFDYGRIPPGTDEMDNIYISKSYSGGRPVIYNGEWEYVKSNLKNWIYNFYRFALHTSKRYSFMPITMATSAMYQIFSNLPGGGGE